VQLFLLNLEIHFPCERNMIYAKVDDWMIDCFRPWPKLAEGVAVMFLITVYSKAVGSCCAQYFGHEVFFVGQINTHFLSQHNDKSR